MLHVSTAYYSRRRLYSGRVFVRYSRILLQTDTAVSSSCVGSRLQTFTKVAIVTSVTRDYKCDMPSFIIFADNTRLVRLTFYLCCIAIGRQERRTAI